MSQSNKYPNAWDFSNIDQQAHSPNKRYRIEYSNLNEFHMGSPMGGECYLVGNNNEKCLIDEWCGGPPVWSQDNKVAIGKWVANGIQKIYLVDPVKMEITVFKEVFTIVNLRDFADGIIRGVESPVYKPMDIVFDTQTAKIEETIKIKHRY